MSNRDESTIDNFQTFFRHCRIDHGNGLVCRTYTHKWGTPEVSCCQLDYWMKTLRRGTFCLPTCSGVLDMRHTRMLFWLLMVVSTLTYDCSTTTGPMTAKLLPIDHHIYHYYCVQADVSSELCLLCYHGAKIVVCWLSTNDIVKKCRKNVEKMSKNFDMSNHDESTIDIFSTWP